MKKVCLIAAMCFSICLTACGVDVEEAQFDVLSASDNTVTELMPEQTTAVSSEKADIAALTGLEVSQNNSRADVFNDKTLVPSCVSNLENDAARKFIVNLPTAAELSNIKVNNADIDISDITLDDFLEQSGLERCIYGTTDLQFADYEFISGMYGTRSDKDDPFSFDSMISVEIVDSDGNLVSNNEKIIDDNHENIVKGVYASDFFMNGDFDITFYGGIKCGMSLDDVYAALGSEGFINGEALDHSEFHYFCNGCQVLIIMPEDGVVDEIMLLNI